MLSQPNSSDALSLDIEAGCVGFASEFASTEETRYYLNGVFIEPSTRGGVIAVATDGHRLVAIHDPEGRISAPTIIRLPKPFLTTPRRYATSRLTIEAGVAVAFCDAAAANVETIDGTFPEWRKVIPAPANEAANAPFQARYLGAFQGIARWLDGTSRGPIRVQQAADTAPALVAFGSPRALGVLMPMSANSAPALTKIPAWVSAEKPRIRVKAARAVKEAA